MQRLVLLKLNMNNDYIIKNPCRIWNLEQTKEARFMPSLVQDMVQIGIIFNGNNEGVIRLLKGDILNPNVISDKDVEEFVNEYYCENTLICAAPQYYNYNKRKLII